MAAVEVFDVTWTMLRHELANDCPLLATWPIPQVRNTQMAMRARLAMWVVKF
jgi:hypothetical protein